MGAARLKIIDLESGDQPILSEDGDFGIAFNGEIYKHLELRAELEKLGHRFVSHSDTETVLRSFIQWDKIVFRACGACSPSRCGRNQKDALFLPATAWASSHCTSRASERISSSARSSRRCSSIRRWSAGSVCTALIVTSR